MGRCLTCRQRWLEYDEAMKKKTASDGVVIKGPYKTSGNIDPVKLRAVIRRLQAATPFDANKKVKPIRVQDTATGSGMIRLVFGSPRTTGKAKAKSRPAARKRSSAEG